MSLTLLGIDEVLQRRADFDAIIDARSPAEFAEDHLPGAVNWPVLDDEERRIVVILIPGKIDSGDAPVVLDNIRAEIRKNLTAAEYTVIDSEEQVSRLESLSEEADYSKLVGQLEGLGEFVHLAGGRVSGELEPYIAPDCQCRVTTRFDGVVQGDVIRGTYVTLGAPGGEQGGTWEMRRR